ncbi:MAG: DUF362 domain-containing protein [Spirochaetes bacterium]|nr:MAG: DUF362 domain-containing protein [Spirochaetota bacterium]
MAKVALVRCESYEYPEVRRAVERGVALIGGIGAFVAKGQRVLLKPNLLVGDAPEKCVNTHHTVFRAVAEMILATGAYASFGDSPAVGSATGAARKCGILAVADELGVSEADFKTPVEVFHEKGVQNRKFVVAKAVLDNDVIVSLPKLKTHAFEKFTGCVKNQFGCIPGVRKGEYHIKLPDAGMFAQMLVDLNGFVKPALYVMDGIHAMEGNGPRGGKPRAMNVLLFSSDPIALDATVCRMINVNPEYVPTVKFGHAAGMGVWREADIELLGDDPGGFRVPDFDIDRAPLKPYRARGFMRFLSNRFVPKPFIIKEKCVACGVCVQMCPTVPKSVDWFDGDTKRPPSHNYRTCIRCYCCQELCPESAIELRFPLIRRALGGKR